MVWQTAKWLGTYDIWHAGMDQLQHFAGQEPSFSGLVTATDDRLCIFCQLIDSCGWLETIAGSQSVIGNLTVMFQIGDQEVVNMCRRFLFAKVFCLEVGIIQAVHKEVQKIRTNCLCTFCFQKLYQIIVCQWKEFDKDFSYNTNTRLFDIF